jgi:hypothetical protein
MNTRCLGLDRVFGVLLVTLAQLLSGVAAAAGSPEDEFAVWAIGLPNGFVAMEHESRTIEVSAEDVARGMLEISAGTRLLIVGTKLMRVAVRFRSSGHPFRAVKIGGTGDGAEFTQTGEAHLAAQGHPERGIATLNYRFTLAPDTVPGTYAWPLQMNVHRIVALHPTDLHERPIFAGVERE